VQISLAQDIKPKVLPIKRDSIIPSKKDAGSILKKEKDSLLLKPTDSIQLDSIAPKETLEGVIVHVAKDYTIQNAKDKTVTLYNEAQVTYTDIDLKAGIIIVDYKKNTLYAKGIIDSLGNYIQKPIFKQGNQESEQDSISYNFKTKRALIYGLKTSQGQIITYGEKTKRVNDSTIYVRNIRFTTSDKKIPDYYIATKKAKLVPGKKIIVGASNLVLADIPTPIFLPFAYFPLTEESVSGLIIPAWNDSSSRGFSLQNGGYYFAINDYVDLTILGDVYTNGGWALRFDSSYNVRYKFSGNFSFNYENNIQSFKGFDDYTRATNYNIRWSYSQAGKANPNSRFSASVNLGSSKYYQQSLNEVNNSQFLTNTLNSSISYYKKFVGTPFQMTTSINHSQNTNTESITMTLPNLRIDMDRIFPFAGKGGIKKNPLQKMGFNYSLQGEYRINTKDSLFFKPEMFETAKSGIRHTTGTSTSLKVMKYFTLSPSVNYNEVWNFDYIEKRFDETSTNPDGTFGEVVTDSIRGFKSFREYNTGVSLSTNIYGTFNFKKGKLKSIRHTFRPSISYSYKPDFADNYNKTVQTNLEGTAFETYSPFQNSIYGRPSAGLSSSVGISINNVLEAKIAPDDPESDEEDRKIFLLNNLNFSSSYNIAADSLRWSTTNVSAGTRFLKDKLTVNLSGSLDPYQITDEGTRIDKFNPGIFRLTNANLTANYAFSSKDFSKKDAEEDNSNANVETPDILGAQIDPTNRFSQTQQNQSNKKKTTATTLYKADIPWTLNLAYAANYSNNGYSTSGIQSHSVMFSGNIELSPKWGVGFSSGYDIKSGGFTYSRFNFSRDLDSWQFNFNWVPFGTNTSYTFFIGVKASVLSDLKYDKNKPPDRRLF
jgi:hypothetical protein